MGCREIELTVGRVELKRSVVAQKNGVCKAETRKFLWFCHGLPRGASLQMALTHLGDFFVRLMRELQEKSFQIPIIRLPLIP